MVLKRIKVEVLENQPTNCYIIEDENTKETMVIDPGGDFEKIDEMIITLQAKVKYIYLTHCHGDHTAVVNQLKQKTGATILIHRDDAEGLIDDRISLITYIGMQEYNIDDFSRVDDGDIIHIGAWLMICNLNIRIKIKRQRCRFFCVCQSFAHFKQVTREVVTGNRVTCNENGILKAAFVS